jgi:hypothetical protein
MKKIISLVLIGVMCFTLVGCGNDNKNNTSNNKDDEEDTDKQTENLDFINDNDSYFIIIDGKKFYAGDKIADLSSVGYNLKPEEATEEIPANRFIIGAGRMVNTAGQNSFDTTPFNKTSSSIQVSDSVIGAININYFWVKDDEKSVNFEIYGGIKLGSTEEEVKKVFGEPSSIHESDITKRYTYKSEELQRDFEFEFDKDDKVSIMKWRNLTF